MQFSGKMCLIIILKATKNQGFTLSLEDTFFEKPQRGEGGSNYPPPLLSRFRVNQYKAVACMCAYLSKSGDERSQVMSQTLKEAFEDKLGNYQQMKSVAQIYVNKRECSIQECVCQV